MLVGPGVAFYRGGVHAPFVGEGTLPHVGLITIGAHVGQFKDERDTSLRRFKFASLMHSIPILSCRLGMMEQDWRCRSARPRR